jgi:hypothetical protein
MEATIFWPSGLGFETSVLRTNTLLALAFRLPFLGFLLRLKAIILSLIGLKLTYVQTLKDIT